MSCEERADRMLLFAAGALDDEECLEIEDHLRSGCRACRARLTEAESLFAQLAASLDPAPPSPAVKEKLLARVRADSASATTPSGWLLFRPSGWLLFRRPVIAAGLAAIVGAVLASTVTQRMLPPPASTDPAVTGALLEFEEELAALEEELGEQEALTRDLEAGVRDRDKQIRMLRSPRAEAIELVGTESFSKASGRVFWEWDDYYCYFYATGLDETATDRVYVLWLYNDRDEVHAVGSFGADRTGHASLFVPLPRGIEPIVRTVVTLETGEAGDRPTGRPVLESHPPGSHS